MRQAHALVEVVYSLPTNSGGGACGYLQPYWTATCRCTWFGTGDTRREAVAAYRKHRTEALGPAAVKEGP
jgi:hypothetical protein